MVDHLSEFELRCSAAEKIGGRTTGVGDLLPLPFFFFQKYLTLEISILCFTFFFFIFLFAPVTLKKTTISLGFVATVSYSKHQRLSDRSR